MGFINCLYFKVKVADSLIYFSYMEKVNSEAKMYVLSEFTNL